MIVSKNKNNINYFKVMMNIIKGDRGDDIVNAIFSDMILGYYGENYGLNSDYAFYFNTSTLSFSKTSDGGLREIKLFYDTKKYSDLLDNGAMVIKEFKESILESILESQSEYLKIMNAQSTGSPKINELTIRKNYSFDMFSKDEQLVVILSIFDEKANHSFLDPFTKNVYYNNNNAFNNTIINFINKNPEMFFAGLDGFNEMLKKRFFAGFFNPSYYQYTEKVRAIAKEKNKEK